MQYTEECSVLLRIFSVVEDIQYCGGYSVLLRMSNTVQDVQYCGGCSGLGEGVRNGGGGS